jgi:hypothetical protein
LSHPVDQLIARLIRDDEVDASPEEIERIVERIASAPFNRHRVRVPRSDRGMAYGDFVIGRVVDPLEYHLVKRVVEDGQWIDGTTADDYLADLRAAAQHPHARVLVYERAGDLCAATISATRDVVIPERLGPRPESHVLVVYSARHSVVRTAYMYSEFSELDMPEGVWWLR